MIPRRILIYGVSGAGKTTFARNLANIAKLPFHCVDDLCHLPNWGEVPPAEQRRRFEEICSASEWILDSAYASWVDIPFSRADLIIGLDYPRWLSLGRLVRRSIARVWDQQVICNGNRENLRLLFSRQSIVLWHFQSYARKRDRMRKWASEEPSRVIRFTHPRQADVYLKLMESMIATAVAPASVR